MPGARTLFLIDGIGALVTATLLVAVVAQFEPIFGMPANVVYVLAVVAGGFAVFSLSCFFGFPSRWPRLLQVIAIANLSYCGATLILVINYRGDVTPLGAAYFIIEVMVVVPLAIHELRTARRESAR